MGAVGDEHLATSTDKTIAKTIPMNMNENDDNAPEHEDQSSSKITEKLCSDTDVDSDSAVSVLDYLNGKTDNDNSSSPSRFMSLQSDKSAIIRLNSELLKAKQSNWEVVDALTTAYDDIHDLRKREQRLNNILSANLGGTLDSGRGTESKILNTQLEIRGEELSKSKDNVRRLMEERDRLREECCKTRAHLRLLTLQNKQKDNELCIARNESKTLKHEMKENAEKYFVLKENGLNLEHQLRTATSAAQRADNQCRILTDTVHQRDQEREELKKRIDRLENENETTRLAENDLVLDEHRSTETEVFKQLQNELANEIKTMKLNLLELEEKSQKDDKTIEEMSEKLLEWEKYGARMSTTMDEYIHEVNAQHLEARDQIAAYIDTLEKELASVKSKQESKGGEGKDCCSPQGRPQRKHSSGKKLPIVQRDESFPATERKLSGSSLSGALDSEGSVDDVGYVPSDANESDVSRGSSTRKGRRRTLPHTPSDIEALTDGSDVKVLRDDDGANDGQREFPRRSTQDSGLGESLYGVEGRTGRKSSCPRRKQSKGSKPRDQVIISGGESPGNQSDSFRTITPLSQGSGSPQSTAADSDTSGEHTRPGKSSRKRSRENSPRKRHQVPVCQFLSHDRARAHRRHAALLLVFRYLTPVELCALANVCREWRSLSEHPTLWRRVALVDITLNNMSFLSISRRCKPLEHLYIRGLKKVKPRENPAKPTNHNCYFEKGLEYILKVTADTLLSLHIEDCENFLTDRCLVLTGSYCRNLQSFTYISDAYPACPEAIWSLWSCRNLSSLRVPPLFPSGHPKRFNDKSCETIANCWPTMRRLTIGGPGITTTGLVHIAQGCLRLQELELDRTHYITEETAYALCLCGLKGLQVLMFTFTPASPAAIKQFYAACPRLEFIALHVGISDYFTDVSDTENIRKYQRIIKKLERLREENSDLAHVLRIKADYG